MKSGYVWITLIAVMGFGLSGCVVRTYEVTKKRVDQDLSAGNRGFLHGRAGTEKPRKEYRTTRVVEMEFGKAVKFERRPKMVAGDEDSAGESARDEGSSGSRGNKGFLFTQDKPETVTGEYASFDAATDELQEYVVRDGDTLQKISQKFYGTTRKWQKIFEANTDTLSSPDKIYPGQVINIPMPAYKKIK
ncbi:MAG: LysM peptidoglycan-binding domain-containing protein [Candidatus Omnitrophica bacterium]|nr:LysM peptidoglycan-binding domain-containing protein [Candidatus Omnitrophota bacterium]